MLLLIALVSPAQAIPLAPPERTEFADSDLLLTNLPYAMRLELGVSSFSGPRLEAPPSVFTSLYWSRAYDERSELEHRFGIHLTDASAFRPYALQQTPVPGHPQFNFVQEWRRPGGALSGLQFERKNLFFDGDRLTIRTSSDLTTLARGAGFSGSEAELDVLSLLGWRSHSRLVWQLGEPTREFQWQFSAGYDRHSFVQSSTVDLGLLRRF